MRCYYHQEIEAIGICKNCQKDLCQSCAVDIGNGLACKGHCEAEVRSINDFQERNKTIFKKSASIYRGIAVLFLVLGLFFVLLSIFAIKRKDFVTPIFALFFLSFAGISFSSSRKITRKDN